MTEGAQAQYWEALDSEQFERYERRQGFVAHFASSSTTGRGGLGVVASVGIAGCCALSSANSRTRRSSAFARSTTRCARLATSGSFEREEGSSASSRPSGKTSTAGSVTVICPVGR
jgi:hypothetical protein